MESAEGYVYFAESNAIASAGQVREHTRPTSPGDGEKRTSALKTSRATRRRLTVHFEDSDDESEDEVLGAKDTGRIGADRSRKVAHAATDEKSGTSPSRLSYLTGASRDEDSPITPTAAEFLQILTPSSSLFIPEDRSSTAVRQTSTHLTAPPNDPPNPPDMDGLNRARAIKAEISSSISLPPLEDAKTSTKPTVDDDLENQLIKTLRQDQDMSWSDIAAFLNQERRNRSEAATFTEAAVYSRFVRATPRIATAASEIGFDPKDYMHLRHPNHFAGGTNSAGGTTKAGKKRVKDFANAKELDANVRKHLNEGHEELETVERTEQLMNAVAKIERNFWVLVADEMERMTTKMYKPDELAGRYHAI